VVDILLSPSRIGWPTAVLATVWLIALGESVRTIAWARNDAFARYASWTVPFHGKRPRRAFAAASERLKSGLRPAAILPLVLAPMPMMRPPADITTAIVGAAVLWWLVFTAVAVLGAQITLRSAV
jgi:hypothetical protein